MMTGRERYVGLERAAIGMKGRGASAQAEIPFKKFSATADKVVEAARNLVKGDSEGA